MNDLVKEVLERFDTPGYGIEQMRLDICNFMKLISDYESLIDEKAETPDQEAQIIFNAFNLMKRDYDREKARHAKTKEQVDILIKEKEELLVFLRKRAPKQGPDLQANPASLSPDKSP